MIFSCLEKAEKFKCNSICGWNEALWNFSARQRIDLKGFEGRSISSQRRFTANESLTRLKPKLATTSVLFPSSYCT